MRVQRRARRPRLLVAAARPIGSDSSPRFFRPDPPPHHPSSLVRGVWGTGRRRRHTSSFATTSTTTTVTVTPAFSHAHTLGTSQQTAWRGRGGTSDEGKASACSREGRGTRREGGGGRVEVGGG